MENKKIEDKKIKFEEPRAEQSSARCSETKSFACINIKPELLRATKEIGFEETTTIQAQTIPLIKAGKDVIGQSGTGSGKTAAFGLPMLEIVESGKGIQALILVPTRELAEQVSKELVKFSKYLPRHILPVYGGVGIERQINDLRRAEIVVGTPVRMLDHLEWRTIDLSKVKMLVLDEADKMFEMGFIDDVRDIVRQTPQFRQTLLFSATISSDVIDISERYMKDPEIVRVEIYVEKSHLKQAYYNVSTRDKFSLLVHLIKNEKPKLAIIFCATRHRVDIVATNLEKQGINAEPIHGGLTQARRNKIMEEFHAGKISVLVASDVAARGLDIKNVTHIINYDIPKTDKEYLHRIGRTARAGEAGKAISLLAEQDYDNFRHVQSNRDLEIEKLAAPQFQRLPFDFGRRFVPGGFHGHRGLSASGPRRDSRSRGRFSSGGHRPSRPAERSSWHRQ